MKRLSALDGVAVLGVAGVALLVFVTMGRTSYDVWGGVVVAIVLVGIHIPLLRMAMRRAEPAVARLLPIAFGAKLAASLARYAVVFAVYDGNADAGTYHEAGLELFRSYRGGDFGIAVIGPEGTIFMRQLTGAVYALAGPTKIGGFLVFATLGFWGAWLFVRAFSIVCPEGNQARYAKLVLFLPSILFWPASIGKEAWMTLALGVGAYGMARLLRRRPWGIRWLVLGIFMASAVRPHVAGLLVVSAGAAFLLRRSPGHRSITAPLAKVAGIVGLGIAAVFVVNGAERVLGIDDFNRDAVTQTFERASRQTTQGGSVFDSGNEETNLSPSRFPSALMSVLFRPFPWEATNAVALVASAEGVFLAVLSAVYWRSVVGAIRSVLRTPYALMCVVYSVLFVYGFSAFANFGILTRQRVQVLPFILVLVCVPPFRRREQGGWRSLLLDEPTAVRT